MGYEDDPYRDEDGEPLMDYDDFERSPDRNNDDDGDGDNWRERGRSQTPVRHHHDGDGSGSKAGKPRKRLIKKSNHSDREAPPPELFDDGSADDDYDGDNGGFSRDGSEGKRKKVGGGSGSGSGKKEKRYKVDKYGGKGSGSSSRLSKRGLSDKAARDQDGEVKEMWDTIAGGDSEDYQEGQRTLDDENFIDDTGVDPADRYYGSDNEQHSLRHHPEAEEADEDEEIDQLFKMGKKRKKNEKSPAEIAMLVENVMAELEVTAEEDAELNRQCKPAVNKLKKLPLLMDVLSKKQLQLEFLDHGVLTLLKNWLEPLPDGSLPNINIRAAILKILNDFPMDLEQYDRKEQLKKSGLGKVIMFLSKSDEETTSNRKLAKELVDKWSRPIFNKSTRFEDMRAAEDERVPYRRPAVKKPANNSTRIESRDGDLDLDEFSRKRKSGQSSARQLTTRPEATPMDFVVRPQSKIDPDEIRARAKQNIQDQRRLKMNKKLQQLKAPKKKQLQATKLSVEGRGMVKYL